MDPDPDRIDVAPLVSPIAATPVVEDDIDDLIDLPDEEIERFGLEEAQASVAQLRDALAVAREQILELQMLVAKAKAVEEDNMPLGRQFPRAQVRATPSPVPLVAASATSSAP